MRNVGKVVCIIQARLRSTRLPAKVLRALPTGRTVLEEVVHRCHLIDGVHEVVVASPEGPDSELIQPFVGRATFALGPEHDVLKRYAIAAEATGADIIMRITADCPLLDPQVCSNVLAMMDGGHYDYVSNVHPRSYPVGWDCEVFTRQMLEWADTHTQSPQYREHVTTYFTEPWQVIRRGCLGNSGEDRSHIRWTLDTIDDYVVICEEFRRRIAAGIEL